MTTTTTARARGIRAYLWASIGIWTVTSVLGNALHVLTLPADEVTADLAIAIAVNTVPAVTLFLTIHIATLTVFRDRQMSWWQKLFIALGLIGVGGAAFRLSWDAQTTLAASSGINPGLAWIYPFAVDAAIVICTLIALWTERATPATTTPRARRSASTPPTEPVEPRRARAARADIPPVSDDELMALVDEPGASYSSVAEQLGRSKSWVGENVLRIRRDREELSA